jgi:predicted RNase H-like nuclease (RuvC/YqgF family)
MKKFTLIAFVLFSSLYSIAQNKIQVTESNESFSTGKQNALVVTIFETNKDDVEKGVKKLLKDWNGSVKSKSEIFGDDCQIKKIGKNTFDVYATVNQDGNNVKVAFGIDLGGAYLNSGEHKEQFGIMKDLIHEFAVEQTKEAIGAVVKAEEKKLKDLEKEKDSFDGNVSSLKKDIEDYKSKIEKAEKDIKENEKKSEDKNKEIGEQKKVVEDLKKKQSGVK